MPNMLFRHFRCTPLHFCLRLSWYWAVVEVLHEAESKTNLYVLIQSVATELTQS